MKVTTKAQQLVTVAGLVISLLGTAALAGCSSEPPKPTPNPQPEVARADSIRAGIDRLRKASASPVDLAVANGYPTAVRASVPVAGGSIAEQALDYLHQFRDLYGVTTANVGLQFKRVIGDAGNGVGGAVFEQTYRGVPVFGAQLSVPIKGGRALGSAGMLRPDLVVATTPAISAERARALAAPDTAKPRLSGAPSLTILDPTIFGAGLGAGGAVTSARLAWQVFARAQGADVVFVDALTGDVLLRMAGASAETSLDLHTFDDAGTLTDYSCFNLNFIAEASFSDPDAQAAKFSFGQTDAWYKAELGRDSYDGNGAEIDAYLHASIDSPNARADRVCEVMEFSSGWPVPDVTTHEFTHLVTYYRAGLENFGMSAALNESYSDVMAFAQTHDPRMGEGLPPADLGGRAELRDISKPPGSRNEAKEFDWTAINSDGELFPDHLNSHSNSRIPSFAAWFIARGGIHPDTGVVVNATPGQPISGIGENALAHLYYDSLALLPGTATFDMQRAVTIIMAAASGFDDGQICAVTNAFGAIGVGDIDSNCDGILERIDADDDLISDPIDNCPGLANTDQLNLDGDSLGNACDADIDGDGIDQSPASGLGDNCPYVANPSQADLNLNHVGLLCDPTEDTDNDDDGVLNQYDNCPYDYNPFAQSVNGQLDVDHDGEGDACDPDMDADDISNDQDNCPATANHDQVDGDQDLIGDACDPCPGTINDDVAWGTITYFDSNGNQVTQPVLHVADVDSDGRTDGCDFDGVGHSARIEWANEQKQLRPGATESTRASFAVSGSPGGEVAVRLSVCGIRCASAPDPDACLAVGVSEADASTRAAIVDDTGTFVARFGGTQQELRFAPVGGRTYDLVFGLLADTRADELNVTIGRCGSAAPTATPSPAPTPSPTQTPGPTRLPTQTPTQPAVTATPTPVGQATLDLTVNRTQRHLTGGACETKAENGRYYFSVLFVEEGDHYFSLVVESADPITAGSYTRNQITSTLQLAGVTDQDVAIEQLTLAKDLVAGTFSGRGLLDRANISGSFVCG